MEQQGQPHDEQTWGGAGEEHSTHQHHQGHGMQPQQFYNPHLPQVPPHLYQFSLEGQWGGGPPHLSTATAFHPSVATLGYYDNRFQYPVQHMEGVPLPPGIPGLGGSTDPLEAVLGRFPCVRLRNLPYDAAIEDILLFFQGLVLIDVVLVGHGEAFVVFANPMDFQMALQRNRQTIGRRFVEIEIASRSAYYEAIAAIHEQERGPQRSSVSTGSSGGRMPPGGDSVASRGDEPQPPGDTAAVVGLWSGGGGGGGGAGGEAMHGLGAGSFEGGMAQHMPMSGLRPPPRGLHAPLQKRTGGGIQIGEHTGFLRMRGLPFSAAGEDIFNFFSGYNPIRESIVLTYRSDGRATGEAYVGFASPDDAKRAMELHRKSMGNRYIELFISNKDEQGRALARFGSR